MYTLNPWNPRTHACYTRVVLGKKTAHLCWAAKQTKIETKHDESHTLHSRCHMGKFGACTPLPCPKWRKFRLTGWSWIMNWVKADDKCRYKTVKHPAQRAMHAHPTAKQVHGLYFRAVGPKRRLLHVPRDVSCWPGLAPLMLKSHLGGCGGEDEREKGVLIA